MLHTYKLLQLRRTPARDGVVPLSARRRKAQAILEQGRELGAETVLLDYRAHGESPGDFQSLGPGTFLQQAVRSNAARVDS